MSEYYLLTDDSNNITQFPKNIDIYKGNYTDLIYGLLGSCNSLIIYATSIKYSPKFEAAIGVALGMNKSIYLINYNSCIIKKTIEGEDIFNFEEINEFIEHIKLHNIKNQIKDNSEESENTFKNASAILACAMFEKSYPDPENKFVNIIEFDLGKVKEFYKQYDVHFDNLDLETDGVCRTSYSLKSPPKLLLDKLKKK